MVIEKEEDEGELKREVESLRKMLESHKGLQHTQEPVKEWQKFLSLLTLDGEKHPHVQTFVYFFYRIEAEKMKHPAIFLRKADAQKVPQNRRRISWAL